ncbi:SUMF1/EgtB/PvdO family nonheme iron enzyme [Kocuria sp. JC486]|uniref:formylglycine-generating enzyme family protein n=1 Tax=Kocuria sp. JC486 TaxID=1970736 RepID=UPI001FD7F090|nr:SUMF1/EgtB/PvdO family nonheme iron enzyme [Kocuria sp. JC486]
MLRSPMVQIPAGSLTMADARNQQKSTVELHPFSIASTPVTVAQFEGHSESTRQDEQPATGVTWYDALTWCNRRSLEEGLSPAYDFTNDWAWWDTTSPGYRLPTEAEWEYACRAGTTGPTYGPLQDIAWTALDDLAGPQAVGLKQPNAFGLHDTLGNVWEWCWDLADPARYGRYRTIRGGGWADPHWSCRASVRRSTAPDAVIEDIGFRPARGAAPLSDSRTAAFQGWSDDADRVRARVKGFIPFGWTPLSDFPT